MEKMHKRLRFENFLGEASYEHYISSHWLCMEYMYLVKEKYFYLSLIMHGIHDQ